MLSNKAEVPTWNHLRLWRSPPRCLLRWRWSLRLQGQRELELELPQSPPHPHPEHLSTPVAFSIVLTYTIQSDNSKESIQLQCNKQKIQTWTVRFWLLHWISHIKVGWTVYSLYEQTANKFVHAFMLFRSQSIDMYFTLFPLLFCSLSFSMA